MTKVALPGGSIPYLPVDKTRPKGLAPYTPRLGSKNYQILSAARAVIERYRLQGRLPLGSRETGYVLTGEGFTKKDIDAVEDVIVRARRAGLIAWEDISDGRTSSSLPWIPAGAEDAADSLLDHLETAQLDRQRGQKYRIEVWAEAASWIERLTRMCHERGVPVHSGSGSVPVNAIRNAAIRAFSAFALNRQETVILHIGDLDVNGLRNIARPFEHDLHQFAVDIVRRTHSPGFHAKFLHVRRLLLTAEQVEEHVPENAWDTPSRGDRLAGWPWDFKVQAEALLPEIRDEIVLDALDALSDASVRARAVAEEESMRSAARAFLSERLRGSR